MTTLRNTTTLAHGYTMGDLDELTRLALSRARKGPGMFVLDASDRWDCAWHAIVEHLYTSARDETPERGELIKAGAMAVRRAVDEELHHRGIDHHRSYFGHAPNTLKYWLAVTANDEGFVERLVEYTALYQVLSQLTPDELAVVAAIAVHGDQASASTALGWPRHIVQRRLAAARAKCDALWVEHETPRSRRPTADRCRAGHLRSEHGVQNEKGHWSCRACQRAAGRRFNARNRSAA